MIMINNQWYNIQSMDDIQQIIADEFSDELANEFEKFKQKYTDADYWEVYWQLEEAESMLESAEDDADYYQSKTRRGWSFIVAKVWSQR